MNYLLLLFIKVISILLHITVILITVFIILFSNNKLLLSILAVCQFITFYLIIQFNGCIISKYEEIDGGSNLTKMAKRVLHLSDDMNCEDFEKMFVAIPLLLCIIKLSIITIMPKNPYIA